MKIINHGNNFKVDNGTENFKCHACGCEFEVNTDEYYVENGSYFTSFRNKASGSSSNNISSSTYYAYKAMVTDNYICSCPECHKIVTKKRERLEHNPTITLTSSSTGTASKECSD